MVVLAVQKTWWPRVGKNGKSTYFYISSENMLMLKIGVFFLQQMLMMDRRIKIKHIIVNIQKVPIIIVINFHYTTYNIF